MDEPIPALAQVSEIISILREIKELHEAQLKRVIDVFQMQRRALAIDSNRFLRELLRDPRYGNTRRLEHYGYEVFSEGGEDGIIQEIFHRIGTTNRRFVEFGASDGNQNNTHFLLYQGWSGLWMEAIPNRIANLRRVFAKALDAGVLSVRHTKVTVANVNDLIRSADITGEIDLLSIDIDNQDYHVCRAINVISPRVIVIECNSTFPPPAEWVVPFEAEGKREGFLSGASLASMTKMMAGKGYVLVGTEISGTNAFYVRNDLVQDRFVHAGDVHSLYNPPRRGFGHVAYSPGVAPPAFWIPAVEPPASW